MFFSEKTCEMGKVFEECGSTCPKTCTNRNQDTYCQLDCNAGCVCPRDTYIDLGRNSTCVKSSDCTCFFRDEYFESGDSINVDCNKW